MSTIPFTFPLARQLFESFETKEDIKALIKKEAQAFIVWKDIFKFEDKHNRKYIYVKCRHCKAVLRYKWSLQEQSYRLMVFNNQHIHVYEQQTNEQLSRFINDLPIGVDLATARNIAMNQFDVTASKFYHMFNKIKRNNSTLPDIIKEFERRDYDISLDPYPLEGNSLPDIIVVISPQMKKLFKLYGQTVSYDLTYNIIQQRANNSHQYAVGVFTGVNCYNRIIPFGITITCVQTTEAFAKIFQTFIQVHGSPQSFVTDQQQGMIGAIKRLHDMQIFKGTHLFDSFHVIRNFGKTAERKDLQGKISEIIKQQSPIKYELKMDQLKAQLKKENEMKAYHLFSKKVQHVCFSQLKRGSFVIFNASNSINEKMNDLIKCRIRSQRPYTQAVKIITQFAETVIHSAQGTIQLYDFRIQGLFEDSSLKIMRFMLAKRPMQEFLRQYVASLSISQVEVNGDEYTFREKYIIYQCMYGAGQYECSCGYFEKTGIGCRHMLYICRIKGEDYTSTIHPRWKFDKKPDIVINRRSGARKTRKRN